jgi:peptide subunit release factor 1 (eRF1)
MFAGEREILERTLEIEREVERKAEERLVGELFETARAGGRAVYGIPATLEAIWQGRVHRLVVADDVRLPGSECPECRRLAPEAPTACPACGARPTPLVDVVERAIERTLDESGTAEVVHGPAGRRLREEGGGLGALLRF